MKGPAACERKGAVLSYDLTRLPNETDDARMDQAGDKRPNQERASGHLIWNDRKTKQDQTTDTCPSSDNISRRGPPLGTRLYILVLQTIHVVWTGSTTASGRTGLMKRRVDLLSLSQEGQFLLSAVLTNNVCRRRLFCLKLFGAGSFCRHSVVKAQTQREDCVSFPQFTVHTLVCYADHTAPPRPRLT